MPLSLDDYLDQLNGQAPRSRAVTQVPVGVGGSYHFGKFYEGAQNDRPDGMSPDDYAVTMMRRERDAPDMSPADRAGVDREIARMSGAKNVQPVRFDASQAGGAPAPRAAQPSPKEMNLSSYLDEINSQPTAVPLGKRSWGSAIADTGRSAAAGVGGLIKSGGTLYGLVTGDMQNGATQFGDSVQNYWEEGESPQLQAKKAARQKNIDEADGVGGKAWSAFKDTVTDPALAVDTAAGNLANFIPGMAAGRAAMAAGLARGMIPASAATLGTGAAVGAGAIQQGADVSGDSYDLTMKKDNRVWANNPEFMLALKQELATNPDPDAAVNKVKQDFATRVARGSFAPAAAISVATSAIPGATMPERTMLGGAARDTIKAGAKQGLVRSGVKGALGEATQEALEEGGGAFAGNVARQRYVDPDQDLSEKVGENAGIGAAGGFILGAPGGAMHRHTPATDTRAPALEAGEKTDLTVPAPPLQLGNTADPLIGFPDGTVARRSEIERHIASLPSDQQVAARAKMMGLGPQPVAPGHSGPINYEDPGFVPGKTEPSAQQQGGIPYQDVGIPSNFDLTSAPARFGNEIDFPSSFPTTGLATQLRGDERTQNLFPGMTPQSGAIQQQDAPGFLQPSGDMGTESQQRELDLQPPQNPRVQATLDDIVGERFKKNGGQQQLPFANINSPKAQILLPVIDSLAAEQHMDESTHVQATTMVAMGKFAAAQKLVNEALKEKAAADAMVEKVNKLAEKEAAKQEQVTVKEAPTDPVVKEAPTEPVAKPTEPPKSVESEYDAVPRAMQNSEQSLIDAVESAKSDADYSTAMDRLYTAWETGHDTPTIDQYINDNAKDKAFNRAFNEAEVRANNKLTEGVNGIGMGRSTKALTATITPETVQGLTAAMASGRHRVSEPSNAPKLSQQAVEEAVQAALKSVPNAPHIEVLPSAESLGQAITTGAKPKGVTFPNGRVVIFADAAESVNDVYLTVFHELVHRGVSSYFTDNAAYVKKMLELATADKNVRDYAKQWKLSEDGQDRLAEFEGKGDMGGDRLANYEALAVEEALARISEDMASNRLPGKRSTVRTIAEWFAKLAETMGMKPVAQWIRRQGFSATEQFVQGLIARSGDAANLTSGPMLFRSEKELSAQEKADGTPLSFIEKNKRRPMGLLIRKMMGGWRSNPWHLGFLSLDQIADRFPEFKNVSDTVQKWLFMGQRANQLMNLPSKLTEQWGMLTRKSRAETDRLNKLFVDSTIAEAWVDQPHGQEPAADKRNAHLNFKDPEVVKSVRELRNTYLGLPKEHQQLYSDVTKALGEQFKAKQRAILKHVVDMFADDLKGVMTEQEMLALAELPTVDRTGAKAAMRPGMTQEQRLTLQKFSSAIDSTYVPSNAVPGPYFPLQRKGDHIVVQKSKDYKALETALDDARNKLNDALNQEHPGDETAAKQLADNIDAARATVRTARTALEDAKAQPLQYKVSFFESRPEADDFASDARKADQMDVSQIIKQEYHTSSDGVPSGFLAKITDKLSKELPKETAQDVGSAVRDLIIKSLPDRSAFKSELRRMKVDGVKPEDALDSFKAVANRNAWAISRLENVSDLTKALTQAHASTDMDERVVGNELAKRYAKSLSYTPHNALIDAASNLSYLNHLGFSVGYYFQNMLQPWTVSAPILGGRHGLAETGKALTKATQDTIKAMTSTIKAKDAFNLDLRLNLDGFSPDEKKVLQQLTDEGRIDITVRADLGVGGSTTGGIKHVAQRAAEISSWPAHQIEVVNRVATALAAFRMEMTKTKDFNTAMAYADKIVAQTHVDYSAENAPRFMNPNAMGGLGRLAFQFKRYQQAMVFLWGKTLTDAIKQGGWNENTKALTYLTGVNFAMAGASGIPLAAPIGLVVWAVSKAFGDADDDKDWLAMFWAGVRDTLGQDAEDLVHKGVGAAMGVDMSSSLGQGSILSPMYRLPQAKTGQEWAGAMALQLFGAAGGTLSNWADALMVAKDNPAMAIQKTLPKGIAGLMAAYDRTEHGLTDRKGTTVIGADELGMTDFLAKGLSLGESTKVTDMYDTRSAISNADQARQEVRSRLLRQASRARQEGDSDAAASVREKIDEFNDRHPAVAIKPKDIFSFYQGDIKRQKEMVGGIRVNKRNADIAEQYGVTR